MATVLLGSMAALRARQQSARSGRANHYPNEQLTTRKNDDRSNTLNPNNSAHKATINNRSSQMNPNNTRYPGPRSD